MTRGRVIVKSSNILRPPLLDTDDAKIIEFRDDGGNLLCFWVNVFDKNPNALWGFCKNTDEDWVSMCNKFGVSKTHDDKSRHS